MKNPMIFNGSRSYIHSDETIENRNAPYKLFIASKGLHNEMSRSIELLTENLMKVYRGLFFMKERENIGFQQQSQDEHFLPNRLIAILLKMNDF